MKFIINQKELSEALKTIKPAIPNTATMPILQEVYVECLEDKAVFIGNNLETAIRCEVKADVEEEGKAVLSSQILMGLINEIPKGENIQIQLKDGEAKIQFGMSVFNVKVYDHYQYPSFPDVELEKTLKIEGLDKIVNSIKHSYEKTGGAPVLSGVLIDKNNFVTTDSFKLSIYEHEDTDIEGVILPGDLLVSIARIVKDKPVDIVFSDRQVLFTCKNVSIIGRLIAGEYPNYKMVIPDSHTTKITINTEQLLKSMKRVNVVNRNNDAVIMDIKDNELLLKSIDVSTGSAKETMEVEKEGEDIVLGFNGKYMSEILGNIEEKEMEIEFSGALRPIVMKEGKKLYLLMPVKVND